MLYGKTHVKTTTKGKTTRQGNGRNSKPTHNKKLSKGQGR